MLTSLLNVGCIPDYLLERYLEFTPIDSCANAIIKLAKHPSKENRIFHLYDYNHVDIRDFINFVNNYTKFDIVSSNQFIEKVNSMLKQDNSDKLLAGILRDFDVNQKLTFETKIKVKSDFSIKYLQKIGFVWPKIDENYLSKFLDYFHLLGYMNFKEEK